MKDFSNIKPEGERFRQLKRTYLLSTLTLAMLVLLLLMAVYAVAEQHIDLPIPTWHSLRFALIFSAIVTAMGIFVALGILAETKAHKRTEEALRESEERYRTLFERVPVGLYRTTPNGQILDANPALVEMLRYADRESLLSGNAKDVFVNPDDRRREQALLEQVGVVNDFETQLRRCDGTVIWVEDTVRSIRDAEGRVLYYDGSLENITQRKRAEEYARRAEGLVAMGKLTASLAHEVKNPLQAIQSNLELLRDFPLEADERAACLQVCSREVERLIGITQRMLIFSRTEHHTFHPISILRAWEQALTLLNKPLEAAAVQVSTDFPDDLPSIWGVADQIDQVLLNLVLNSIEAMPHGGEVNIKTDVEGEMLVLTLANNGPPIPAEHIDHIFDPFFTTKPEGTGLGLFISHNIIQQHGGTLSVENRKDEVGVVYTITLPTASRNIDPTDRSESKEQSGAELFDIAGSGV